MAINGVSWGTWGKLGAADAPEDEPDGYGAEAGTGEDNRRA